MHCTRAKGPASRGAIRFVQQRYRLVGAARSGFESMILSIHTGLTEAQCVDEKALGFLDLAHGKHRAVKSMCRLGPGDLRSGPALALVGLVFDNLERQSSGMPESDERLSESFGDRILVHVVPLEMLFPERQRSLGHSKRRGGYLSRARAARLTAIRKRRHHRTRLQVGIRVVQMINGKGPVHQ